MKNIITAAVLVAVTATGAMAGNYKTGHSQDGYNQTYSQLVGIAAACGTAGMVPLEGPLACAGMAGLAMDNTLMKVHMKKSFRDKIKKAAIGDAVSFFFPFGGTQAAAGAISALATSAAMELHDEMGARQP